MTRDYFEERDIPISIQNEEFKQAIRGNAINHGADVVVLDNLGQFVGAEYNDAPRIHDASKFAYSLARDANAAVIIPSHPRKNGSGEKALRLTAATKTEFFESLMGSSHFINSMGSLWGLERDDEHDRITFVGGRQRSEGGDRTLYIQYEDGGQFRVIDDAEANRDNVLNTVKRKQAWDLLPNVFSEAEAERAVKSVMRSKGSVNDWIKALAQARLIEPAGLQVAGRGTRYKKAVK